MSVGAYQFQSDIHSLAGRFREETALDRMAEARAKKLGCSAGISVIGVVLSLIAMAPLADRSHSRLPYILPMAVGAVGIVLLVAFLRERRFDLDNRKLATVTRFLGVVEADTPKSRPVSLSIDFRDTRKAGKRLAGKGVGGVFSAVRVARYSHAWLEMSGTLADGSWWRFQVVDRVTRKEKRKRKYTKVRQTTRSVILFELRPKPSRGVKIEELVAVLRGRIPPNPLAIRRIGLRGDRVSAVLLSPPWTITSGPAPASTEPGRNAVNGDTLLEILMWGYDGLRHAARGVA